MKTTKVKLGYFPKSDVSGKQLGLIQSLLEEKEYGDAYHHYITRYGRRNPYKRITRISASKLIDALINNHKIEFLDLA